MMERTATVRRETRETTVEVSLVLEGAGQFQGATGNGMLDHMLAQLARHGLFDITVNAKGDTTTGWHHTVEDTAIVLGRAFREALGEGRGIVRMGHAIVPLDEALALVAVDVGGRGYAAMDLGEGSGQSGDLSLDLVSHFLESFAQEGRLALHVRILSGHEAHHRMEAVFKALAKALRDAVALDPRQPGDIPSTKGTIQG